MAGLQHALPTLRRLGVCCAAAALVACSSSPPAPVRNLPPASLPAPSVPVAPSPKPEVSPELPSIERTDARWTPVSWGALPGWGQDDALTLWPTLRDACAKPPEPWRAWCSNFALQPAPTDALQAHLWLMKTLQPYRITALSGSGDGIITGYFEPELLARRVPNARFKVPLWAMPSPAVAKLTRAELNKLVKDKKQGLQALLYLEDPVDAMLLQVQGSGRLRVTEPDGRETERRVAYAGHNQQPFQSLARWLVDQGALTADNASWFAIKVWALQNPKRVPELLAANPRVIFFREEPLLDPNIGPRGAQGLALTPGRSVAVDPRAVPYGTLLWLDTTEPLSADPLRRLVLAQDTGSAITGAVRADLFWGWGESALAQAGRMKQPLRWWALWPKGTTAP